MDTGYRVASDLSAIVCQQMQSPIPNAMSGAEMFRLIAKTGGLGSAATLASTCGDRARGWVDTDSFPRPAWKVGRIRLYAGWDCWEWMENHGRIAAANALRDRLQSMPTMSWREVL